MYRSVLLISIVFAMVLYQTTGFLFDGKSLFPPAASANKNDTAPSITDNKDSKTTANSFFGGKPLFPAATDTNKNDSIDGPRTGGFLFGRKSLFPTASSTHKTDTTAYVVDDEDDRKTKGFLFGEKPLLPSPLNATNNATVTSLDHNKDDKKITGSLFSEKPLLSSASSTSKNDTVKLVDDDKDDKTTTIMNEVIEGDEFHDNAEIPKLDDTNVMEMLHTGPDGTIHKMTMGKMPDGQSKSIITNKPSKSLSHNSTMIDTDTLHHTDNNNETETLSSIENKNTKQATKPNRLFSLFQFMTAPKDGEKAMITVSGGNGADASDGGLDQSIQVQNLDDKVQILTT